MASTRGSMDSSMPRYTRKHDMDVSMLEYSHRMRELSNTKAGFSRLSDHGHEKNAIYTPSPSPCGFETISSGHTHGVHETQEQRSHKKARPHSFDEKELKRNQAIRDARPRRDTKSERPPPLSSRQNKTLDKARQTQKAAAEASRRFRISMVNASDLYDIVDISLQDRTSRKSGARLANASEGVRIIEETNWATRVRRDKVDALRPKVNDKPTKSNSVSAIPDLVIKKSIKNDSATKMDKPVPVRLNNEDVYVLDKDSEIISSKKQHPTSRSDDARSALGAFIEQALSKHNLKVDRLKQRPKRAKRMQLHKPDLLVIPEDGGSFIRPQNSVEQKCRNPLILPNVPSPSATSLAVMKEMTPRYEPSVVPSNEHITSPTAPLKPPPRLQLQSIPEDAERKTTRKRKEKRVKEDQNEHLDDLLLTNIYPPLPWEAQGGRGVSNNRPVVTTEQSSQKSRNKPKTKRLIFLRDQSEDDYR